MRAWVKPTYAGESWVPLWAIEDVERLEDQSQILIDLLYAIKEENPSIKLAGPLARVISELPAPLKGMLK
jgi:hypothetical protein